MSFCTKADKLPLALAALSKSYRLPLEWLNTATLGKHAYLNILKILPPKNENFSDKKYDIFHITAQNIACGYSLEPPQRGGSNEYQQSMFLSRNKKNNAYPCKSQFYYIKVGFHYENTPIQIYRKFHLQKLKIFR